MPTYTIVLEYTSTAYVDIEADTLDEATAEAIEAADIHAHDSSDLRLSGVGWVGVNASGQESVEIEPV